MTSTLLIYWGTPSSYFVFAGLLVLVTTFVIPFMFSNPNSWDTTIKICWITDIGTSLAAILFGVGLLIFPRLGLLWPALALFGYSAHRIFRNKDPG